MLSLTFKNLWARKWRSFMTALAVVFGIALVSGTYVLTDTTNEAFNDIFVGANENTDVAITAKEQVAQEDGSNPGFDASVLTDVEKVEGVRIASGDVFSQGAILDIEGDSTGGGFAPQFIASASPEELETSEYSEGRRPEAPTEAGPVYHYEPGPQADPVHSGKSLPGRGSDDRVRVVKGVFRRDFYRL